MVMEDSANDSGVEVFSNAEIGADQDDLDRPYNAFKNRKEEKHPHVPRKLKARISMKNSQTPG